MSEVHAHPAQEQDENNMKPELGQRLRDIRHVALDMDGTIYCGSELFAQTLPFLETLRTLDIGFTFLTNNSSKAVAEYSDRLAKFGIEVTADDVFTSTHAAIALLRQSAPELKRLFVVGTPGFRSELRAAGFTLLGVEEASVPDAVLLGFDTALNYSELCKAAYWIQRGLPYYATHPDFVCPTDQPTVLLDCGAICAAIEAATGRAPDAVAGKPEPAMLQALARRLHLSCAEIAMVGDRLYTDVLMAKRADSLGVLTLTGETQSEHLASSSIQPDLVIRHLGEFSDVLRKARRSTPSTS